MLTDISSLPSSHLPVFDKHDWKGWFSLDLKVWSLSRSLIIRRDPEKVTATFSWSDCGNRKVRNNVYHQHHPANQSLDYITNQSAGKILNVSFKLLWGIWDNYSSVVVVVGADWLLYKYNNIMLSIVDRRWYRCCVGSCLSAIHVETRLSPAALASPANYPAKQRISNLFLPKFWTILTDETLHLSQLSNKLKFSNQVFERLMNLLE